MDLLKTPSVLSLLDSDLDSVDSLQCLDIEELDEVEYALPASEAPTLAEILNADEGDISETKHYAKESAQCSALQVDFLQAVSQQVIQAQERSSSGQATGLSISVDGKLTVGTAHGHLLSFKDQVLRWVCDANTDRGAVSSLAYNEEGDRLLVGFARGMICQYESSRGLILRRVSLGGEIWGILRVTWAGTSGLALDTGGSVWLIKFSRPLGVRAARTSCIFSGARGEVVAMAPRDGRVLALATLSRVMVVAGGRAAGVKLAGPPNTLPVLAWCEADERLLLCARAHTLQWLTVDASGASVSLRPIGKFHLDNVPLWLGWVGGGLAVLDIDENLRLWGEDYNKPLDLSYIEPVYASAFFKGVWTDGRVSGAMSAASGGALGGACARAGTGELCLLGRRGVVRVRARDKRARAHALFAADRHAQAMRLLLTAPKSEAVGVVQQFITELAERPHLLRDKTVAEVAVKLCLKFELSDELWSNLWEHCSEENAFVEAIGDAAVRGELSPTSPSPECTQALIERLAQFEPSLVERVVASLPLTSLDPHRASVFTRSKGLWRGVGAIAAALGGASSAMRELTKYVERSQSCRSSDSSSCRCAGDALLLVAADGLAGRGPAGRLMPDHCRPSARHEALQTLLSEEMADGEVISPAPLCALVRHDARSTMRLLEQSWREPPFVGPLGKQNRLRVVRALLYYATDLEESDQLEMLEFMMDQIRSGGLPAERSMCAQAVAVAARCRGERADRALLALSALVEDDEQVHVSVQSEAEHRPRLAVGRAAAAREHRTLLQHFFTIPDADRSDTDVDELLDYLHARLEEGVDLKPELDDFLERLIRLRPKAVAAIIGERYCDTTTAVLRGSVDDSVLIFAQHLLEIGALRGDAVAAHLRNLCRRKPSEVNDFLSTHSGAVRPEEALAIVREQGPRACEPACLEACGDPAGALDVLLQVAGEAAGEGGERSRLVREACALCARVAGTMPRALAAVMWARAVRVAAGEGGGLPPGALLDAVGYLPASELVAATCRSARTALRLMEGAAGEVRVWRSAALLLRREAAWWSARERRGAGRGVGTGPGGARCTHCGGELVTRPTGARLVCCRHGARAHHAECPPPPRCVQCTCSAPLRLVSLAPRVVTRPSSHYTHHELMIVAPPRPDLEGII